MSTLWKCSSRETTLSRTTMTTSWELALSASGKQYRLFPPGRITGKNEDKVITILKRHGSIDWFDREPYENNERSYEYFNSYTRQMEQLPEELSTDRTNELVFGKSAPIEISPVAVEEEAKGYFGNLRHLYRADEIGPLLRYGGHNLWVPFLVNPSTEKLAHLQKLRSFWQVYFASGIHNRSVAIIGYSLPEHDEYVRQDMYFICHEYLKHIHMQERFPNNRNVPSITLRT